MPDSTDRHKQRDWAKVLNRCQVLAALTNGALATVTIIQMLTG